MQTHPGDGHSRRGRKENAVQADLIIAEPVFFAGLSGYYSGCRTEKDTSHLQNFVDLILVGSR